MPDPWGIDIAACRRRQQRLTVWMQEHSLDRVLLTQRENIQWVTGVYYSALFAPVAMLTVHGQCLLVAPQRAPEAAAVDEVLTYPAKQHSTLCNDQKQRATEVLLQSSWISGGLAIGTEFSAFPRFLQEGPTVSWHDVESVLYRLRRRKEPDELAKICRAIAATEKMYAAARDCISPGISELEVFNRLQSVAVQELGEPL
ncbi:MAG: aminopeptidase P family N-terminal domain-containing protein, partial [Planctomycetota bacterium]|nr:aminopeptidase P family N-terminal domain-containing protein [Planctomycetota bacterium]